MGTPLTASFGSRPPLQFGQTLLQHCHSLRRFPAAHPSSLPAVFPPMSDPALQSGGSPCLCPPPPPRPPRISWMSNLVLHGRHTPLQTSFFKHLKARLCCCLQGDKEQQGLFTNSQRLRDRTSPHVYREDFTSFSLLIPCF